MARKRQQSKGAKRSTTRAAARTPLAQIRREVLQIPRRLEQIRVERHRLDQEERELVDELRAHRWTWSEIGQATGLRSRQGAQKKFGGSTTDE